MVTSFRYASAVTMMTSITKRNWAKKSIFVFACEVPRTPSRLHASAFTFRMPSRPPIRMLKGRFSQGRYADMMAAGMRMKAEFLENKWASEEQWNRIHTPIGLEIKSKTVEEIAISIAAELIQVRNKDKR